MIIGLFSVVEWNYLLLILNAVLWTLTLFYYWRKRKRFTLGCFVLALYALISVVGIHLYIYHPDSNQMFTDLRLFPYLYLYGMILLVCIPIFKMEGARISRIVPPNIKVFHAVCVVLVLLAFYRVDQVFYEIREGLALLFLDSDAGLEAYKKGAARFINDRTSGNISGHVDYVSVLGNVAKVILPAFWMYYLALKEKNRWMFAALSMASFLSPLYAVASGSRYAIVNFMVEIVAIFFFLYSFFTPERKESIRKSFGGVLIALLIPFLALTVSRSKGDTMRTFYGIERYLSESFIHFNNHGLDAGGMRNGDRTMPLFKQFIGMETAANYATRISKYKEMKINESVFISFVGDFTLDFGPVWPVVIFICISRMFYKYLSVQNHVLYFHQYILLYTLLKFVLGFFLYLFSDPFGNLELLVLLSLYCFFRLVHIRQCFKVNRRNAVYP